MMMFPRLLVLAVALLGVTGALAGCLGGEEPLDEGASPTPTNTTATPNATLPDGRGTAVAFEETNVTEEGVGGIEHKHDYWSGKETIVLYDDDVTLTCPPCMPDGEGSQPKSVAYLKLGELPDASGDALVYEGAERVELLFGAPAVFDTAPNAAPVSYFVQYRSAADSEWRDPMPITIDTPVAIEVTPQMTDMPHSTRSLWVFRITSSVPDESTLPLTITVFRGRDVVDWPGHPEFYANGGSRVVMDQHVTTHMSGFESSMLYDSGGTWAYPERLISWGTQEIVVIANVTSTSNALGAAPTGFFLEVHNATVIGPEVTFGSRHSDVKGNNDLTTYEFHILVDDVGMDGPYQPASRWGFRLMAVFATLPENPVANGLCPGCFPYDIEYDIKVLALDHETGTGEAMEEPV